MEATWQWGIIHTWIRFTKNWCSWFWPTWKRRRHVWHSCFIGDKLTMTRELPQLVTGRRGHACGGFLFEDRQVRMGLLVANDNCTDDNCDWRLWWVPRRCQHWGDGLFRWKDLKNAIWKWPEDISVPLFRSVFPIENVRNIINPSQIDQSRLQCDYKRMLNPATIHWIGNQILGTCFFLNPDRIGLIIWQSTKNVAIRQQF